MTDTATSPDPRVHLKRQAAEQAVQFVQSGMVVGLGTGSTAIFATRRIGELLRAGELKNITAIATSRRTDEEARQLSIPMMDDGMPQSVDITIDGADEIDPFFQVIKGGGGALLREKIVAQASARVIIVADETKLSDCLGTRFSVPVEVLRFGWRSQAQFLESLGAKVSVRENPDGTPYLTDSGNLIVDCNFGPIPDPGALAIRLGARAGVVEHGLFLGIATDVIIAAAEGTRHLQKKI
jgi:ribose 5-phosphate isomerase A